MAPQVLKDHIVFLTLVMIMFGCYLVNGASFVQVNKENQQFIDGLNRTRIFHGVNAVYKVYPFHPDLNTFNSNTSLTDIDLQNLKGWGFNVIRLMMSWQGTEPIRNQYDYKYLSKLKEIIRKAQQYDIMIILDVHQDVMSDLFCGEGFPRWAVQYKSPQPFPFPFESIHLRINQTTGAPIVQDCLKEPFFIYYLTQGASNAFQNFYNNLNGLRDSFANFWKVAANYFKDEENVLGLEIINEPWPGDIYEDLSLLLDQRGKADRQNLIPLYQQVYSAIRSVNSNHLVFFEPTVTDLLSSGFDESPLGTQDLEKQVYSYHVYCADVNSTGDPKSRFTCRIDDDITVVAKESDVKRLKTGGFLTEFGALSNFTQSEYELDWMTGLADQYLRSWTYWQFKYYNDMTTAASPPTIESFYGTNGQLQIRKVKALSRTYVPIVCGDPINMKFDPLTSDFRFSFKVSENCRSETTVIYLNRDYYYPNGFSIKLYPSNSMNILKQTHPNYVELLLNNNVNTGQEIQIQISSK